MAMFAKLYYLILPMTRLAKAMPFFLLFMVGDLFSRRRRPTSAPLVSGIAPGEGGSERPLSETQLRQLEAWLRLHQEGWRRNIIPPLNPSYMVQVEHSDTVTTMLYLFCAGPPQFTCRKSLLGASMPGGSTFRPPEVEGLIGLLREEA